MLLLHDGPRRERGIVAVIVAVAALALFGAGALTFDVAHSMLNKTRLQTAIDAAALAGASELDLTGDEDAARTAARAAFLRNAEASGNRELKEFYDGGGEIEVQFSTTLHPFSIGTTPPLYVRARANNMPLEAWLAGVLGITEKTVSATAVAGPSPPLGVDSFACNLAPMMVCGDPAAPAETTFGYDHERVQVLKTSTKGSTDWEVGPGNFQLARLEDPGGAAVREALAGGYGSCNKFSDKIETEPGNTVGPVVQGINTRLGKYLGPMKGTEDTYPPDVVTQQNTVAYDYDAAGKITTSAAALDFNFADYRSRVRDKLFDHSPAPEGIGRYERRMLALPIGDCSETVRGHGFVPLLGYGCFFLLEEVEQHGKNAFVYGQFVEDCRAGGKPGPTPGGGPGPVGSGPHVIQLYEDPDSTDS